VENLHFLCLYFLLTLGYGFDLFGLGGFAMHEMPGEFFSLAERDDVF
jgi:hypothetical protein